MAASKAVVVFKSSVNGWIVPEDCTSIQIECLSGTGYAFVDGDGSAYSKTNSLSVTPGSKLYISVGAAAGGSWVNKVSFTGPTSTSEGCYAVPNNYGAVSACCSGVYNESNGIGNVKWNGGVAGNPTSGSGSTYFGGNGGSAGPNGRGGNGGDATPGVVAGAGGAANGGTYAYLTTPGTKRANSSTGGDGGAVNSKGTVDYIWTDVTGTSYGLSGGSGGNLGGRGPIADLYGGGGGSGSQGLVVITYTRQKPSSATTVTRVFKSSTTTEQYLILPAGTTKVTIDAIGGGSQGNIVLSGTSTNNLHGGGAGGYANTVNTTTFPTGSFIAYQVAPAATWNTVTTNTYASIGSTGEPTLASQSTFSVTAKTAYGINSIKTSIGQRVANGGDGGLGFTGTKSTTVRRGGGGGGAPYWFDGGSGSSANNTTSTSSLPGGGGGGAATGPLGSAGSSGGAATATVGGAGGNAGTNGGSGGTGGTSAAIAGDGTNGGGGGGGFTGQGGARQSGNGAIYNVASWYTDTYIGIVGPVGPGGGGGGANNTGYPGSAGYNGTAAQANGAYGGGGGGGRFENSSRDIGRGGSGLLVITYTYDPNAAQLGNNGYTFGYIID